MSYVTLLIFKFSPLKSHLSIFFRVLFIFRERGREGERKGEKYQCVVASYTSTPPPTPGTWPTTQACALTGNQTGKPLVRRPALNPLSHTCQGTSLHFFTFESGYYFQLQNFPFYSKSTLNVIDRFLERQGNYM